VRRVWASSDGGTNAASSEGARRARKNSRVQIDRLLTEIGNNIPVLLQQFRLRKGPDGLDKVAQPEPLTRPAAWAHPALLRILDAKGAAFRVIEASGAITDRTAQQAPLGPPGGLNILPPNQLLEDLRSFSTL
jgi:hypothetical protein